MKYVPLNQLVGFILRRIGRGNISPNYYEDIKTYIADAFEALSVTVALSKKLALVPINGFTGLLPCGLETIIAVIDTEFKCRVPQGSNELDIPNQSESLRYTMGDNGDTLGLPVFGYPAFPNDPINTDLVPLPAYGTSSESFYYEQGDCIVFSKETGTLEITYWAYPVDEDNMPLIPDVMALKEAIYWYVRHALLVSGWKDPFYSGAQGAQLIWQKYEAYVPEAISGQRPYTPEKAHRLAMSLNKLIIPETYWENAFQGAEHYRND